MTAPSTGPGDAEPPRRPRWSRRIETTDAAGERTGWHVLDTHADRAVEDCAGLPTLVCVHGNPTWSHLWRRVLAAAPPGWRVVAPDQLGMGWSDRLAAPRRLATRIDDLDHLTQALGVTGSVALLVHDWGGPVGLGWAVRLAGRGEADRLRALVITNTAVHQPDRPAPGLIRLARSTALRRLVTETTPLFVRGAPALSRPRPPKDVRDELARPYRTAERRRAVRDFVADIPLEDDHPSKSTLDEVAEGLRGLQQVPALLIWGARDPVFTDVHLRDLLDRLPQAQVQRYPDASHLVTEDVPEIAEVVWRWLDQATDHSTDHSTEATPESTGAAPHQERGPDLAALPATGPDDVTPAVVDLTSAGSGATFGELRALVDRTAARLRAVGVRPGQRVAVLVPPGVELTALVYACWRVGASIVITDANLGLRSLGAALRSASPDHLIGIPVGLAAARVLRIPGRHHRIGSVVDRSLTSPEGLSRDPQVPKDTDPEAAVLFTSGATGPPKGVVYTASRLTAQLRAVGDLIGAGPDDRLVAAFAPFALYGPALGLPAAVPAMDPTRPATLTAAALADAAARIEATVVFASPAALANVVATASDLTGAQRHALAGVRLLLSAGAPVGLPLLEALTTLLPAADLHTPYGMTEMLPVTDVTYAELRDAGPADGTLVGAPLPGVRVRIAPLDADGDPSDELTEQPHVTGEIVVTGAHLKDRYDRQWAVQADTARPAGWHRTGDVGHLDDRGRLWVEGRLVHVLRTADGPLTPVGPEQRLEGLAAVARAALVGVGPVGTHQPVAVLVPSDADARPRGQVLAGSRLAAEARAVAGVPLAAVLVTDRLPVDVRHQAKIDRRAVARWAEQVLAGRTARRNPLRTTRWTPARALTGSSARSRPRSTR